MHAKHCNMHVTWSVFWVGYTYSLLVTYMKTWVSLTYILFLQRVHYLHNDLVIENVHNISLIGRSNDYSNTTRIVFQCNSSVGIIVNNLITYIPSWFCHIGIHKWSTTQHTNWPKCVCFGSKRPAALRFMKHTN